MKFEAKPDEKAGSNIPEKEIILRPNLLDIIKINEHWAQTIGEDTIKYLNDGSSVIFDWNSVVMTKDWKESSVSNLRLIGQNFTDEEISNIRWGSEQNEFPHLAEEVSVFGEFESKK